MIAGMVAFRRAVAGTNIERWWDNGESDGTIVTVGATGVVSVALPPNSAIAIHSGARP